MAAHVLKEAGAEVVVLEASRQIGGRAGSETLVADGHGYTVQFGAQMLSAHFERLGSLIREFGLEDEIRELSPFTAYVRHGRIERLDRRSVSALRRAHILRFGAWWRWGQSYFWNWSGELSKRSLTQRAKWDDLDDRDGSWFAVAWGEQVAEYIDTVQRAFYFQGIDGTSRALFLNLLAYDAQSAEPGSLVHGFGSLFERMAANLDVRLETRAEAIELEDGGVRVTTTTGVLRAHRVIISTSAPVARRLHPAPSDAEQQLLDRTTYVPAINVVVLANRDWQNVEGLRDVYGLMIPEKEKKAGDIISAISLESGRIPGSVVPGKELIHIMIGERGATDLADASDQEVEARVLGEAERYLPGLIAARRYVRVVHHPQAIARSYVGRSRDIADYRRSVSGATRILLAGDYGGWDNTEGAAETGEWAAGVVLGVTSP